ncbi:kinase suppressor of Ras 2 [Physocladia obscura]|uniref:Kinase suppressor of Ras 2 n=1 Tax=Physocladia obscura TaxID=109957 RepID=A0AAD5SQL6_9FUNG|nr:kinase suppressor of Ras 2 [Physocladia obscura]
MQLLELPTEVLAKVLQIVGCKTLGEFAVSSRAGLAAIRGQPASFWRGALQLGAHTAASASASASAVAAPSDWRDVAVFAPAPRCDAAARSVAFATPRVPFSPLPFALAAAAAAVSLWIRCYSDTLNSVGGIAVGCQDRPVPSQSWPHYHWHIVAVDPEGRLRASFDSLAHKAIVGAFVADGNWHHVVLTANSSNQRLFVDGILCGELNSSTLNANMDSRNHSHAQLGTGVISGNTAGKPSPDWTGAFPFNGAIFDFKLFKRELNESEILNLYRVGNEYQSPSIWALKLMSIPDHVPANVAARKVVLHHGTLRSGRVPISRRREFD